MVRKINAVKMLHREYAIITDQIINQLSDAPMTSFNNRLREITDRHQVIECVYVLNESGIQVTDTFCNKLSLPVHNKLFFRPAKRGEDHSLKDYYYFLISTGQSRYTTEPYISLASGSLCITISALFTDLNKNRFILCVDINYAAFSVNAVSGPPGRNEEVGSC